MNTQDTIRSWKDEEFRSSLNGAVPANPAGLIELDDRQLEVAGGNITYPMPGSWWGCPTGDYIPCSFDMFCQTTSSDVFCLQLP